MIPSPMMTTVEVSDWLRVKPSTIRKWVCHKRIPYLKVGRSVVFRQLDIEMWLRQENPQSVKWEAFCEAYGKKI